MITKTEETDCLLLCGEIGEDGFGFGWAYHFGEVGLGL